MDEVVRKWCDFRREIGHISQRVYVAVWGKYRKSKPLGLVFWQSRVKALRTLALLYQKTKPKGLFACIFPHAHINSQWNMGDSSPKTTKTLHNLARK